MPSPKKNNKKPYTVKKTSKKPENNNSDKWVWFVLGIVLATTFIIYFKAINFNLSDSWDDYTYITDNNHLKNLNWSNIKFFFTNFYFANYHPLTMISYALDYKIGAGNAHIFHFNNILLHIINSILVYILIIKISPKSTMVALITAAFFAVHPMHVESIAWVSERKDVLYSFFFLISIITYTYYLTSRKIKHLILTFVFFVLSCLSKSAAVILPLVLLLFDYYSGRKYNWKMFFEKIPFFAISLIFGIVAFLSQKDSIQDQIPNMSLIAHISIVSYSLIMYIVKAFVPVNLSAIYPYPIDLGGNLNSIYYLSILFVGLLLVFVLYSRRWGKDVVFGSLFFVITIILVLQIVPVGFAVMADRYSYIPYIGIFFMIGKFIKYIYLKITINNKYRRIFLVLVPVLGLIIFSTITFERVKIWENDELLFSDVIKKYPKCDVAYSNRGLIYASQRFYDIAKKDFTEAIELNPRNAHAYSNRGSIYSSLEQYDKSVDDNTRAIEVSPGFAEAYNNRGFAYTKLGLYKDAIIDCTKAIELNPNFAYSYNNRGLARFNLADFSGAEEDYNKSIEINSGNPYAYNNRANLYLYLKKYNDALSDVNNCINLDSGFGDAYFTRGLIYYELKNLTTACLDFKKAAELGSKVSKDSVAHLCK